MLALIIGGAYYFLVAFSQVTSVNMVAAMTWGLKSDGRPLVLISALIYFVFALLLLGMLQKPYLLLNMGLSHQGALRGYAESTKTARLYDPVRQEYVSVAMNPPALAAERFDRAFEVVTTYRLFPFDTPLNARGQSFVRAVFHILVIVLFFCLLCLFQYMLARNYLDAIQPPRQLTFQLFLSQGWASVREPLLSRPLAFILLFFLISLSGGVLERYIRHGYEERFADVRNSFQRQIMAGVRPGQLIRGRLVGRMFNYKKLHDEAIGVSFKSDQDYRRTISTTTYTFAFEDMVRRTPVYLCITYEDFADQIPRIKQLDRFFPPRVPVWKDPTFSDPRLMEPTEPREFTFTVNDDYSIALVPE
ncbi:MAG: hypothetical protein KKG47_09230 [Proteobacteria bacterium]|nr:hypothetical protein [Pseudomonadota bacterium]MBU1737154.1 hypothetical protein [Pseudomonadota bacterium]